MKHLIPILAMALLLAACNSAYQTSQPVQEQIPALSEAEKAKRELEMKKNLSFAYEYYKQNNYSEAKAYYQRVFALDTEYQFASHLKRLATCHSQLGQPDSARVILELAVERLPDSHYEHRTLGDLLLRSGDTEGALRQFRICVSLNEEDWESHRDMARILTDRARETDSIEDWDLVLDELDRLIELQPDNPEWARQKDGILGANYDPVEVINSLRQSHESFPDDLKISRKLAVALVEFASRETYSEALPLLDQLRKAEPGVSRHLEMKATALEGLGRGREAVTVLKELVQVEADKPELVNRVGELYLTMGNLEQAASWARRCKRSFPRYGKGYILMAKVYEAAVDKCAGVELTFDDKLVYEFASKEYEQVTDPAFRNTANQRRKALAEVLPTKEDRFFNKHETPKSECYQWLFR